MKRRRTRTNASIPRTIFVECEDEEKKRILKTPSTFRLLLLVRLVYLTMMRDERHHRSKYSVFFFFFFVLPTFFLELFLCSLFFVLIKASIRIRMSRMLVRDVNFTLRTVK